MTFDLDTVKYLDRRFDDLHACINRKTDEVKSCIKTHDATLTAHDQRILEIERVHKLLAKVGVGTAAGMGAAVLTWGKELWAWVTK